MQDLLLPPKQIDLTQAASLDYGRAETGKAAEQIEQFRRVLEEIIHNLTDATQRVIGSQTTHFNDRFKDLVETLQEALNDVDIRLSHLSRAQGQTEEVVDAFIKMILLSGSDMDLSDQKAVVNAFLSRGLPPEASNEATSRTTA